MREILFRGKRKDNGEWVEGRLLADDTICPCDQGFRVLPNNVFDLDEELTVYIVHPRTVGQYTGLTDRNGKRIFEGDIVILTDEITGFKTFAFVEFGNPNGQYNWGFQLVPMEKKPFAVDILHWVEMEETGAFIEVVGNIHNNPRNKGRKL